MGCENVHGPSVVAPAPTTTHEQSAPPMARLLSVSVTRCAGLMPQQPLLRVVPARRGQHNSTPRGPARAVRGRAAGGRRVRTGRRSGGFSALAAGGILADTELDHPGGPT